MENPSLEQRHLVCAIWSLLGQKTFQSPLVRDNSVEVFFFLHNNKDTIRQYKTLYLANKK